MTPRLSGHFSILDLVFLQFLGSLEKIAILTLKPRSHDRILICWTWSILL